MRLKFLCPLLMVFATALPAMAQDAAGFVSVIDDLPLMAQLSEVGDGVAFSTPQGRIAEATARGRVDKADVLAFYEDTLPQLGWAKVGEGHFAREGETLELVFERLEGVLNVRFALAPAPTKK